MGREPRIMATRIFTGDATAVAQVDTCTVVVDGTPADNEFIVTINGKAISTTGDTDAETTADALVVLLQASTIPEFAEITWSNVLGVITATADTAGTPFTFVSSVTGVGAGTFAQASVTANDGPEVWSANNFKDETGDRTVALPTAGDAVIIEEHEGNILYNLDQSGAGDITTLDIRASFTGEIGLPQSNVDGDAYDEYRQRYLLIEGSAIDIGRGAGGGSPKIRLSLDGPSDTLIVHAMAASSDDLGALEIDGNGSTITALTVLGGTVDVARDDATAGATVTTLVVDTGATVLVDANCTLATVSMQGGTLETQVGMTTLTIEQGQVTHVIGNITTANVLGGALLFGNFLALTVATVNMGTGGSINTNPASAAITFTDTNMVGGQSIADPDAHIVFTNAATTGNALLSELGLNLGRGRTILVA